MTGTRIPPALLDKIWNKQVILFLGAGASLEAGAPSGSDLAKRLATAFGVDEGLDLPTTSEYVLAGSVTKRDFDVFIRQALSKLVPSEGHKKLVTFPWQAIYTTNVDTLVEDARTLSLIRETEIKPVISQDDFVDLLDLNATHLFKPHGCISKAPDPRNPLVFSLTELEDNRARRSEVFSAMKKLTQDYALLFVGYSFTGDGMMTKLLAEIRSELGENWLARSYAVMPSVTASQAGVLKAAHTEHLPMKFGEFFAELDLDRQARAKRYVANTRIQPRLRIQGRAFDLSASDFAAIDAQMEILVDSRCDAEPSTAFYKAKHPDWADLHFDLDVRRDVYDDMLKGVISALETKEGKKVVLLTGPGASGKSTVGMRVAHDIFFKQGYPVVRLKPDHQWSTQTLDRLRVAFPGVPVLVFADNPVNALGSLRSLAQYATMVNLPVAFLVTLRSNDWSQHADTHRLPVAQHFELAPQLSQRESRLLAAKLIEKELYVLTPGATLDDLAKKFTSHHGDYLLVILMELIEAKRFRLVILQEWEAIAQEKARRAYLQIALWHQFSMSIKREHLLSATKINPLDWHEEIEKKALKGVIYVDTDDTTYNEYYRTRHEIVAAALVEQLKTDDGSLENAFVEIVRNLDWSSRVEREQIFGLAKSRQAREFLKSPERVTSFFKALIDASNSAPWIYFHYGRWVLWDLNDLNRAEDLFTFGLGKERLSSRKSAYLHMLGLIERKRRDISLTDAERRFHTDESLSFFNKAIKLQPEAEYAYNSKAQLLLTLARETHNPALRTSFLADASETCESGITAVSEMNLGHIRSTYAAILNEAGQIEESRDHAMEALRSGRPAAAYLWARRELHQGEYGRAIEIIDTGLEFNPRDGGLLKLGITAASSGGGHKARLRAYLESAVLAMPSDPFVHVAAGAFALHEDAFEDAHGHFSAAKALASADQDRFRSLELGWMSDELTRFTGVVVNDRGPLGFVRFDQLAIDAPYRVYSGDQEKFTKGDRVTFAVTFNRSGPFATDLELTG